MDGRIRVGVRWGVRLAVVGIAALPSAARAGLPEPEPQCEIGAEPQIPRSGVVLLRADYDTTAESLLARVRSTTAMLGGSSVAGTLELVRLGADEDEPTLMWKPSAPLSELGELTLAFELDAAGATSSCFAENPTPSLAVEVVEDPAQPFAPPAPLPLAGVIDLVELVCCDGAMPEASTRDFLVIADTIEWTEGHCIVPRPLTPGEAQLALDLSGVDPLHGSRWIARLLGEDRIVTSERVTGALWLSFAEPFTGRLEFLDLSTGDVIEGGQVEVPGTAAVDAIDEQDVATVLAETCEGTPYQCGAQLDQGVTRWDDLCVDYVIEEMPDEMPPVDPDDSAASSGCGCRSDRASGPWALLLLLAPLALRRGMRSTPRRCRRAATAHTKSR